MPRPIAVELRKLGMSVPRGDKIHPRSGIVYFRTVYLTGKLTRPRPLDRPIRPALYFFFSGPPAESRYVIPQGPVPWIWATVSLSVV